MYSLNASTIESRVQIAISLAAVVAHQWTHSNIDRVQHPWILETIRNYVARQPINQLVQVNSAGVDLV
jgi:hypothetical protein